MWPFKKKPEDTANEAFIRQHVELDNRANEAAQVYGRHYVDWVEPIKELKRQGNIVELEHILLECVAATEREDAVRGWGVSPWYYEELAILYRKQQRISDEVVILERFAAQRHAPGVKPARLMERFKKARALLGMLG